MKRWYCVVFTASLVVLFTLRFEFLKTSFEKSFVATPDLNKTGLKAAHSRVSSAIQDPLNTSAAVSADGVVSDLFLPRNFSTEELQSLQTWYLLNRLVNYTGVLPNAAEAIREAEVSWNILITNVEKEKHILGTGSLLHRRIKEKQCPYFLNQNASVLENGRYKLLFPCGLTQSSSITVIGIPNGLPGNFQIDLRGEEIPGEPDPPVILHFNVRLQGDKLSEDPIIVQNTWTVAHGWGREERCPSPTPENYNKVDELDQCNKKVGKENNFTGSWKSPISSHGSSPQKYFPFREGYLFVITFNIGIEGIQCTVDGKHITSFSYRESLEPWLVSEARISGDLSLISTMASSLPTSEDVNHMGNFESLKAVPLLSKKMLYLFIGVFSTANNFRRRMAIRRTWMQYADVRSGAIAVRFFVGLHKNSVVNEKLWNEAQTYGDIQLMPFVDYYSLITWKTLAICIFGTRVIPAKYIMKTDDDAFVRVDMVLSSLKNLNVTTGLLFGLIVTVSGPHRTISSKWYISSEEWGAEKYPPWAHGPGYVISQDIAKKVHKKYIKGRLKIFKLEDVAMGIWIAEMENGGLKVRYENDKRIHSEGCKQGYIVAHYQDPTQLLCLWNHLLTGHGPNCCPNR